MKHLKKKSKSENTNEYDQMQIEHPATTAAALFDHLVELTGPLAIKAAWRSADSAGLVEPWPESFEELSTSDKIKVLAHCVCLAYDKKGPQQVQSIEHFDPVG